MKKRMKQIAALSMAALMAASMAACGGSDGGSSSSGDSGKSSGGGDKEIVYWNIGTESPDKDVINKAVEKFNSETESGYTVTSVPTQNDTYKEKLVVAMSSGECPDMYSCWPSVCADGQYVYYPADKPMLSVDGLLATYVDWRDVASWPACPGAAAPARLAAKQGDPETKQDRKSVV